jgi:hypothetical protein
MSGIKRKKLRNTANIASRLASYVNVESGAGREWNGDVEEVLFADLNIANVQRLGRA